MCQPQREGLQYCVHIPSPSLRQQREGAWRTRFRARESVLCTPGMEGLGIVEVGWMKIRRRMSLSRLNMTRGRWHALSYLQLRSKSRLPERSHID